MIMLKMILMSGQWRTSKIIDELRYSEFEVAFNKSLFLTSPFGINQGFLYWVETWLSVKGPDRVKSIIMDK